VSGEGTSRESRLWLARFELVGPCEGLRVDLAEAGATELRLALLAGEARRLELPLPARAALGEASLAALPAPVATALGGGTARFLGWADEQPAARLGELSPALLARARPVPGGPGGVGGGGVASGWPELLLLVLAAPVTLRFLRRPRAALGIGLAAALVVALVARLSHPAAEARVEVLEGGADLLTWVRVEAGRSVLGPERSAARLEVEPLGARVELLVDEAGVRAASPGALLWAWIPLPRPADAPPYRALALGWYRAADGSSRPFGPWPAGAAAPDPAGEGTPAPPGWLASGLPQGTGVLLGRQQGAGEPRYLRVSGVAPPRAPRDQGGGESAGGD